MMCGSVHCVCIGGCCGVVQYRSMDTIETKSEPGTYVVYTMVCVYCLQCDGVVVMSCLVP